MPNENKPDETQAVPATPDAATTPIDLASAFKMLNQANRETVEANMDDPETDGQASEEPGSRDSTANTDGDSEGAIEYTDDAGGSDGDDGVGGSSDGIEAIDFNAFKQGMLRDIQRNAQNEVRREFNEQNIGYYSAAELTVRDENTGQIKFRNPDVQDERDPNYYFKSRSELQQFIDAWNRGIDFEYRKAINEKQQELMQQELPKARLIDFLPKWNAMDATTKQVFDTMLEGHEVYDKAGKHIGFNVNLDAVAAQAAKIAKSVNRGSGQAQPAAQQDTVATAANNSNGPALDMQTGNGKSEDEAEPKNIGEALKMFDKKNKGGK